jgi:hypothetical protein
MTDTQALGCIFRSLGSRTYVGATKNEKENVMTINGTEVKALSYTPGNKYEFNSKDIVGFQLLDEAKSKGQFLNVICKIPGGLLARRIKVTELAKILATMDLTLTAQKQLMFEHVQLKSVTPRAKKLDNQPDHVSDALAGGQTISEETTL